MAGHASTSRHTQVKLALPGLYVTERLDRKLRLYTLREQTPLTTLTENRRR